MSPSRLAIAFLAGAVLWGIVPPLWAADPDVESSASRALIAQIRRAVQAFEKEYIGSFSKRDITIENQDPESREVTSTVEVEADVWEYHGERPTRVVRSCQIDGETVDLSQCEEKQKIEPPYRLFDEESEKRYRLEYRGPSEWKGMPAHRIEVIPLQKTARHLKGDLHFSEDGFRLLGMKMTLADYPFGLQELDIQMSFEDQDGRPVLEGGRSEVYIYVPLLVDERRVTSFRASDQKLLKERDTGS